MKQFKEIWFRGLSEEDKKSLQNGLRSSVMADRLRAIVSEWEREVSVTKSDYDSPSWSHKQAHLNGMAEVIARLQSLLTIPS
jgi:hypothetical protein